MTDSTARLWDRAKRYLAERQMPAARIALESLLQKDPAHVQARLILSGIAFAEGRVREAIVQALAAAKARPTHPALVCDVVEALLRVGETAAARTCLDSCLAARVDDRVVLARMAAQRKLLGQHPESLALFEQAAAAGMDTLDFRFQHALELIFNGQLEQAEVHLQTCLTLRPTFGRAALALSRLRKQTVERNHLEALQSRLASVQSGSEDHAALAFARYKELEDLGRYEEAWTSLAQGNRLMFARQPHDPQAAGQLFERLIQRCTPQLLRAADTSHQGPQPIFIIGMPRSGTTLLDRVLGNHSQVVSAGELDDFGLQLRWATDHRTTLDDYVIERLDRIDYARLGERYLEQTQWRAPGARFFIDKLPRNWMVAGLIRRALPQARILNLVRDPMDVCFSNYRALLGDAFPWSYQLEALGAHYRQYRAVMAHWHAAMPGQILDVPYEGLVRDTEATVRTVLAFCGLPWEPGCLDVTRNTSAVATLSMAQVREPIHARFFDEWRHYEAQLEPLRRAIGSAVA